jgi:hypothetical protein
MYLKFVERTLYRLLENMKQGSSWKRKAIFDLVFIGIEKHARSLLEENRKSSEEECEVTESILILQKFLNIVSDAELM